MRKKVIGIIVFCLSFFILTACSGGLSKKSSTETTTTTVQEKLVDGTYREIYKSNDGSKTYISKVYPIEVDGSAITWQDNMYSIDYDDFLFKGEGTTIAFKMDKDTIEVDNDVYIRVGSDLYKAFIKEGAIENE